MSDKQHGLILAAVIVNAPAVAVFAVVIWDQTARGGTWVTGVASLAMALFIGSLYGIVRYRNWRERHPQ